MRFQIKKILEGYDPADLIEQSMYCFGSDNSDDTAGEENAIAGELTRSDVANVSNVSNSSNYDPQFTANNLQDRGLNPSNFMSADNFAQTTQGGASDPYALNDEAYASMSRSANNVVQNLPTIATSPVAPVVRENIPSYAQQQQNLVNSVYPDAILRLPEIRNNIANNLATKGYINPAINKNSSVYPDAILRLPEIRGVSMRKRLIL